jgi:butyryl-CoA dehydrogenase
MLLRQKAIVEGALSLLVSAARYHDLAKHSGNAEEKAQSQLLLDLLTPVAKTFASEYGFESNALAVQIHGGYGYTSEYRPEAWLRDQKLNTIHEGTSGIQSMDLLGRKVIMNGGAALVAFNAAVQATVERARKAGVAAEWLEDVNDAVAAVNELTAHLGALGLKGDVEGLLLHSADYMQLFSIVVIAWQWLDHAAAAREARKPASEAFYAGKLAAAQYWLATELPRVQQLAALCRSGENSYTSVAADSF